MKQQVKSYGARWIVPVDQPPLRDASLTIVDGIITAVDAKRRGDADLDLGEVVLFPRLVNSHTHLEFSTLPDPLGHPGHPITSWIPQVVEWRRTQTPEQITLAIRSGLEESWQRGTGVIGEIATSPWFLETKIPSDMVLRCYLERLGRDPQKSQPLINQAKSWLKTLGDGGAVLPGLSPHAPYSLSDELLQGMIQWARSASLPLAMHLAESREEMQWMRTGQGPFLEMLRGFGIPMYKPINRPPLYFLSALARARQALVIHGNYLQETDLDFMAEHSHLHLVFCPRTHAWFGHSAYPLLEILHRKINVCVGTDSRASNPDLSVLAELRHIRDSFPQLSPQRILEMGTLNGAKALQVDHWTGSLAPGKRGVFLSKPLQDSDDPLEAILEDLPRSENIPFEPM